MKQMKNRGFTVIEAIVVVVVLGFVLATVVRILNPSQRARMVACHADLAAMDAIVQQTHEQTYPYTPGWIDIQKLDRDNHWKKHYHYFPNAEDTNNGHGNDLDYCDDGNPGASGDKRDCLNLHYVIVCDHDHGDLARYNAVIDGYGAMAFGAKSDAPLVLGLKYWWGKKDPNFKRWIHGGAQ